MMKCWWLIVAALAVVLAARPSNACELLYRPQFPNPAAVRLTGSVLGHLPLATTTAVTIPTVGPQWQGAALRIGIREIVSGVVAGKETTVALLYYGSDCRSFVANRDILQRDFPVGSVVAVRGRATGSSSIPIIAELHEREFVALVPNDLPMTPQGDLDFQGRDPRLARSWSSSSIGLF
jgi:hypothetical protein